MPRRTSRSPRASKASWPSSTMLPNLSMWPIASACSGWWSKKSRSDPKRSSSSTRSPCLTTLRILVIYCVHGITMTGMRTLHHRADRPHAGATVEQRRVLGQITCAADRLCDGFRRRSAVLIERSLGAHGCLRHGQRVSGSNGILWSMALQSSSADLNVRVRAKFVSASTSLSGSKGAAPTAEWLREDASVICARQMPDRWTVCEHILAEYEGQIPTQGCLSPAARQNPFSMRCSACGRCLENVSPSSNSKAPGISTRQDGGSRRLPRLSGWLDKVRIATQARGDSIERGPVEHPEKCSAVGQGIANQHQQSTRSSTKRPDLPGASPRTTGHPHTWVFSARH